MNFEKCWKAMDIKCMRREAAAAGCKPITIPKHDLIKKVYVELVREVVESEGDHHEDGR